MKLKAFAWCLSQPDSNFIKPWISKVTSIEMARRQAGAVGALTDDGAANDAAVKVADVQAKIDCAIVEHRDGGAASSSTSLKSSTAGPKATTKKTKEKATKEKEQSANILKFFKPK